MLHKFSSHPWAGALVISSIASNFSLHAAQVSTWGVIFQHLGPGHPVMGAPSLQRVSCPFPSSVIAHSPHFVWKARAETRGRKHIGHVTGSARSVIHMFSCKPHTAPEKSLWFCLLHIWDVGSSKAGFISLREREVQHWNLDIHGVTKCLGPWL